MLHNFTLLVLGGEWRGLAAGRGRELRADRALRAGVSEAVESQGPSLWCFIIEVGLEGTEIGLLSSTREA